MDGGTGVVIEMDADLQHDPRQLPQLLDAIASGADLAISSRYVEGGSIPEWTLHRRLLLRGGNLLAKSLLRLDVVDATSGFRAYSTELLSRIELADVASDGYSFQVEMVYRCCRSGARSIEVPIAFSERQAGDSKMTPRIVLEAVLLLFRLSPEAWTRRQPSQDRATPPPCERRLRCAGCRIFSRRLGR